jgi:hypothetical protein
VPQTTINRLLDRLDEAKQDFSGRGRTTLGQILRQLKRAEIDDAELLIRYHEALLFLRAYPQNAALLRLAESQLASFAERVARLREMDADLSVLEHPEVSGIAGTAVSDTFGYHIVRWLVHQQQGRVSLDEDWVEDESRLAGTLPRFIPLLDEDALVEANVPYRKWLWEAKGARRQELEWLLERFEGLKKSPRETAEIYDLLKLYVRWRPPYRATRTGMRLPTRDLFYHPDPLIRRKEVSLAETLHSSRLPLEKLSRSQGQKILDLARATSTLRYRELYGFTHGDEARVLRARPGRGVEFFVIGLPHEKRLPLRAYHAAMIFKNGIPVGYFEGLSIFERMESGFNFYYTFREGETAWIYAQTLRLFKQLLGVTVFTLDPYQIGFENEEGIESGAFWFYRKLGFRPARRDLLKLTEQEEKKIAARAGYRTPAGTLRKLAAGFMIYESSESTQGVWDDFQVRNIGLAVQRRMARDFNGDPEKIRRRSMEELTQVLELPEGKWKSGELRVFSEIAPALALVSGLDSWSQAEKDLVAEIISAKASPNESNYLKALQRHPRLRAELVRLGS